MRAEDIDDLLTGGKCSAACLLAKRDIYSCDCRCKGEFHGSLIEAIDAMVEISERWAPMNDMWATRYAQCHECSEWVPDQLGKTQGIALAGINRSIFFWPEGALYFDPIPVSEVMHWKFHPTEQSAHLYWDSNGASSMNAVGQIERHWKACQKGRAYG